MSATVGGSAGSSSAIAGSSGAIARAGSGGSTTARAGAEGATTAGRAGSATTGGRGSAAGASSEVPTDAPVCKGKTSQVAIIGDSFINWTSHTLPSDLAALAGETWRLYAEGGASLQAGGIATLIPDQFEIAIASDPDIKVLVMDGGGNDVLICDAGKYLGCDVCKADGASRERVCEQIADDSIAAFNKLQDRALSIGVRDIVYFYYPDVPTGTIIGGSNPNEVARYAQPKWQGSCDDAEKRTNGKMRCHFVDMVPVFAGHPEYFAVTDIHPNPQGSAVMAKAIIDKMKQDCVWQPAGECACQP
jgi:hypothetical protein